MEKTNASLKGLLIAGLAASALSGCAIVPAEPVPMYAVPAPPPVVVVRPYASFGYSYGPRWRHWR